VNGLPCGWQVHSKNGDPMAEPAHPALAQGKVRFVGDAVAVVIADSLAAAQAGAEALQVDYTPLGAVAGVGAAKAGGPALRER
jgi:carbon-monoxide dehydrogenase large subunit